MARMALISTWMILCLVLVSAKKRSRGRHALEMEPEPPSATKKCPGFDGVSFKKVLGKGASGTAVLVSDTATGSAKVAKLMVGAGSVEGWTHEEAIYDSLTDLASRLPLIMKRLTPGSNCEDVEDDNYGIKRSDDSDFIKFCPPTDNTLGCIKLAGDQCCVVSEGLGCVNMDQLGNLEACTGTTELSKNCLVSILEPASGDFPLGIHKPGDDAKRAATLAQAKALIFEVLYVLRMAFKEQGFQHWDLKEANLMNREWQDAARTEICFTLGDNSLRCISKADLTHDGKTINVLLMDFDNSASGGCENSKCSGTRVKSSLTKHDATSLKSIWDNIRPPRPDGEDGEDGAVVVSAHETAFVDLIDAIPKTIKGNADQISEAEYTAYLAAYDAILTHAFFESDGVSKKLLPTDCTGTCSLFPTT